MTTTTTTKFKLTIAAPGYMDEVPEATIITVEGYEEVAKRVFAEEILRTGEAYGKDSGEYEDAERAATDIADHDLSTTPFGLEIGQWAITAVPER